MRTQLTSEAVDLVIEMLADFKSGSSVEDPSTHYSNQGKLGQIS